MNRPRVAIGILRHMATSVLVAGAIAASLTVGSAFAPGPVGAYVRIEQDWELDIATPDSSGQSPQVVMQLGPYPNSPVGCLFQLNYQDTPSFSAGGVSLQIWNQDTTLVNQGYGTGITFMTTGEKITWTQFIDLSVNPGNLTFGLSKGTSTTWGSVPQGGWSLSTPYTVLTTFSGYYDTSDTMTHSGILLGATSVTTLKLLQVRKYDAKGKFDTEAGQQLYP